MLAYFADAANTLVFILKAFYYPIKILIFYDCNNMWNCQIYSFPEISENFNLTKALHSG